MKLYSGNDHYKLYEGNMLDMLQVIAPCSIDAIVTDPPYGLTTIVKRCGANTAAPIQYGKDGSFARLTRGFMGKEWDGSGIEYNVEAWRKCYQVLKHGGYLLAFGGSRTFYRIACAIEDAGFEIRDTIMWLYGSGFPKSMNLGLMIDKKNGVESKVIGQSDFPDIRSGNYENNDGNRIIVEQKEAQNEWAGWGTALKPAYEPIIVARKPCEGSCVDNVLMYGVGGINIDGCRVGDDLIKGGTMPVMGAGETGVCNFGTIGAERTEGADHCGRYPANVILTYDESDKTEVCGGMPFENDESAARYYYCAKASKRDRDEGLEAFSTQKTGDLQGGRQEGSAGSLRVRSDGSIGVNPYAGNGAPKKNTHPTVKPCDLMQYLIRLVTPPNGTNLDPFNGSGSTGKAAMYENRERQSNYKYIGIEMTAEYLPISNARISYACGGEIPHVDSTGEKPSEGQMNIFDLLGGIE